jgi:hypothetical protein
LRKRVGLSKFDDLKFSYIDTSLYDLFAQSRYVQPIFLNTTYRSVDDIAEYSNSTFYNGRLRVATDSSKLNIPDSYTTGTHWTDVKGEVKSLGADCIEKELRMEHIEELQTLLDQADIAHDPRSFKRYGSARQLYTFKVDNAVL